MADNNKEGSQEEVGEEREEDENEQRLLDQAWRDMDQNLANEDFLGFDTGRTRGQKKRFEEVKAGKQNNNKTTRTTNTTHKHQRKQARTSSSSQQNKDDDSLQSYKYRSLEQKMEPSKVSKPKSSRTGYYSNPLHITSAAPLREPTPSPPIPMSAFFGRGPLEKKSVFESSRQFENELINCESFSATQNKETSSSMSAVRSTLKRLESSHIYTLPKTVSPLQGSFERAKENCKPSHRSASTSNIPTYSLQNGRVTGVSQFKSLSQPSNQTAFPAHQRADHSPNVSETWPSGLGSTKETSLNNSESTRVDHPRTAWKSWHDPGDQSGHQTTAEPLLARKRSQKRPSITQNFRNLHPSQSHGNFSRRGQDGNSERNVMAKSNQPPNGDGSESRKRPLSLNSNKATSLPTLSILSPAHKKQFYRSAASPNIKKMNSKRSSNDESDTTVAKEEEMTAEDLRQKLVEKEGEVTREKKRRNRDMQHGREEFVEGSGQSASSKHTEDKVEMHGGPGSSQNMTGSTDRMKDVGNNAEKQSEASSTGGSQGRERIDKLKRECQNISDWYRQAMRRDGREED